MSAADTILSIATWLGLALLIGAFLLTVWRVVQGPTLPDRVVALDMLVGIVIGFIALIAIRTGFTLYIDIAIALGLVGFLATVAFARFILVSKAKQKAIKDIDEPKLEGAVPVADAVHVEAVGAAARGSEKKSKAKSAKSSAKAEAKIAVKTVSETATKQSARPASNDDVAEAMSSVAQPVKVRAVKARGKSSDAGAAEAQSKSVDKSRTGSSSKPSSKTGRKAADDTAAKATAKPRKRAKEE